MRWGAVVLLLSACRSAPQTRPTEPTRSLVGFWDEDPNFEHSPPGRHLRLSLDANGSAAIIHASEQEVGYRWRVEGNDLLLSPTKDARIERRGADVPPHVFYDPAPIHYRFELHGDELTLVEAGEGAVRLRRVSKQSNWIAEPAKHP